MITVVIPHFEDADGLERCLAALAVQRDAPPFEVIVVDNGSAVPPSEVVARHPGVRLEAETRPGPGPARNRGVALARGGIIAFIDADCVPDPGWLSAVARAFASPEAGNVVGGSVAIEPEDPACPTAVEAYETVFGYRNWLYIRRDGYSGTGNMAVRRTVFQRVGPFAGIRVAEDMDWGRRARECGFLPVYCPEMRVTTPARGTAEALMRKWDRHVAHEFSTVGGVPGRLAWGGRALAVAFSPFIDIGRIWFSRALPSVTSKRRASAMLVRVRLHRARRMLSALFGGAPAGAETPWRQRDLP